MLLRVYFFVYVLCFLGSNYRTVKGRERERQDTRQVGEGARAAAVDILCFVEIEGKKKQREIKERRNLSSRQTIRAYDSPIQLVRQKQYKKTHTYSKKYYSSRAM